MLKLTKLNCEERSDLYKKRLAEGFFTYALLDFRKRYGLQMEFDVNVDITISQYIDAIQCCFEKRWAQLSNSCRLGQYPYFLNYMGLSPSLKSMV